MKRTITATILSATLILGGMLSAAHADTWVFRDTLRPNGHDRSMAVKRADGRKCGTSHDMFTAVAPFEQCMLARGWTLDHVIPDPPSIQARSTGSDDYSPPIDNSSNDDWVARQRDQDNLQQMINTQQMVNDQQMQNDQMFQQQQQQMINNNN
jgi:hypothetical protein